MIEANKNEGLGFLDNFFERNLYFKSKLLTVEGFQREQDYFIYKNQLINCLVHGYGILYGLDVIQEAISFNKKEKKITVKLSAGAALDCFGRLILVPDSNEAKEAEDTYQTGKPNYLYLVYDEFADGTASALDETSCDNACTDDYTKETYKLIISGTPPAGLISGTVTTKITKEEKPIWGAKIEALDSNKTVKAVTFTNKSGKYNLFVSTGEYTLQASAPNFESKEIAKVNLTDATKPLEKQDFTLIATSSESPLQLCQELTQAYYTDYLRFPPECNDAKVFLAVLTGENAIAVDEEATARYRSVVYNNPMLYQLLCDHLNDFNNPHRTTAAQVKALQSVNDVGNNGKHVPNIDLESSETQIKILGKKDEDKIDLNLEENAVKRKNLNQDVINGLLTPSDETITVEPDNDNKTIRIRTSINPGIAIATGVVNFLKMRPGASNISSKIRPFPEDDSKKMEGVAIVMAVSREPGANSLVFMGELENRISNFTLPIITAIYQPEENFFQIFLHDRRQVQSSGNRPVDDDRPIDWKVRWWAIPATKPIEEEVRVELNENRQRIINDPLLLRIAMQPGVTREQLVAEDITTEQLNNLPTELITVKGRGDSRKYFIKEEN